ncbi:MAG: aminotransferase [Deltaproteobacteria bacterium]|nr:aminotransferase [Deltaproteobacteria bacterium]
MKPTPKGWPRLSSALYYKDAAAAIDWLCTAFGFEVRLRIEGEGGRIEHSELVFGEALIFVSEETRQEDKGRAGKSPRAVGGVNTQSLMIFVDDVDAHCAHARASGATISYEPKVSDYGEDYWTDKSYQAEDLEGHQWWFTQRLRDPK